MNKSGPKNPSGGEENTKYAQEAENTKYAQNEENTKYAQPEENTKYAQPEENTKYAQGDDNTKYANAGRSVRLSNPLQRRRAVDSAIEEALMSATSAVDRIHPGISGDTRARLVAALVERFGTELLEAHLAVAESEH